MVEPSQALARDPTRRHPGGCRRSPGPEPARRQSRCVRVVETPALRQPGRHRTACGNRQPPRSITAFLPDPGPPESDARDILVRMLYALATEVTESVDAEEQHWLDDLTAK